jgi:hypothetical protein
VKVRVDRQCFPTENAVLRVNWIRISLVVGRILVSMFVGTAVLLTLVEALSPTYPRPPDITAGVATILVAGAAVLGVILSLAVTWPAALWSVRVTEEGIEGRGSFRRTRMRYSEIVSVLVRVESGLRTIVLRDRHGRKILVQPFTEQSQELLDYLRSRVDPSAWFAEGVSLIKPADPIEELRDKLAIVRNSVAYEVEQGKVGATEKAAKESQLAELETRLTALAKQVDGVTREGDEIVK